MSCLHCSRGVECLRFFLVMISQRSNTCITCHHVIMPSWRLPSRWPRPRLKPRGGGGGGTMRIVDRLLYPTRKYSTKIRSLTEYACKQACRRSILTVLRTCVWFIQPATLSARKRERKREFYWGGGGGGIHLGLGGYLTFLPTKVSM